MNSTSKYSKPKDAILETILLNPFPNTPPSILLDRIDRINSVITNKINITDVRIDTILRVILLSCASSSYNSEPIAFSCKNNVDVEYIEDNANIITLKPFMTVSDVTITLNTSLISFGIKFSLISGS